jgi:pimeloyl-ACP methyl ester carboxylesterase
VFFRVRFKGFKGEMKSPLESLSAAKRKLLARRIRGEAGPGGAPTGARREPSLLVDLQPERPAADAVAAGRPPFFCVHAIGGAVLSYRDLAVRLGGEQPFYGIQAAGLAGGDAVDDLPAMAAQYAAAVEAAAPHGPYLLGGWSFGGVVAFEMARQMRQRGRPVALVALFDSWAPGAVPLPAAAREDDIVRLYLRDQAGLAKFTTTSLKVLWLGMSSRLTAELSDAGSPARPNCRLTLHARVRSSDLCSATRDRRISMPMHSAGIASPPQAERPQ